MSETKVFVNAAACGDLDDIKRLLLDDTTAEVINATDKDGRSALHYACLNDDVNLLPMLLEDKRVDLAKTTPKKENIFHLVAKNNCMQAMHMLLDDKEVMDLDLINGTNKFNETPLHLCAGTGNKTSGKTALILMKNGAKVTVVDQWLRGPVDAAWFHGHVWLYEIMKAHVRSMSQEIQDEVARISEKAREEQIIKVEISEKTLQDRNNMKALFKGGLGNINLKKTNTVEKHIFSSIQGNVAPVVGNATQPMNQKKILSKLIDFPGDREEITKLVADPDVDVTGKDAFGLTALHKFCSWNKPELVDLIAPWLTAADYNNTDLEGKTALHWACEMGSVGTVKMLVSKGADKTIEDKMGKTALDILSTGEGDVITRLKTALGE